MWIDDRGLWNGLMPNKYSYPFYGLAGLVKRVWFDEFETMRIRSAPLIVRLLVRGEKVMDFSSRVHKWGGTVSIDALAGCFFLRGIFPLVIQFIFYYVVNSLCRILPGWLAPQVLFPTLYSHSTVQAACSFWRERCSLYFQSPTISLIVGASTKSKLKDYYLNEVIKMKRWRSN